MRLTGSIISWLCLICVARAEVEFTDVFRSGQDGYHTFRIPAVVVSSQGTVLAFCEGRKGGAGDTGAIDLVLKRSRDGGKTWSSPQRVWGDANNTCGNPCPVLERATGTLWLLLTWNRGDDTEPRIIAQTSKDTRRVFVSHSADDGVTWAQPTEITAAVKPTNWTWYATGPGAGIQIERGKFQGRLVIPCDHIEAGTRRYYGHVIYSDDRGQTWRLGGSTPRDQVNECEVVELSDDRLMLNLRNYDATQHTRQVAFSTDGGMTWTDQHHAAELVEPICQASIRRYSWPGTSARGLVLFSNPASLRREKLTVRLSYDDGRTWPAALQLHAGPAAYSCLAVLPGRLMACLYECGGSGPYELIRFARFSAEDFSSAGRR